MIIEVVAALIWNQNKFMICQRPAHKARGLLWEFVGGKVEPGETKEQALIRECRGEWVPEQQLVDDSRTFVRCCQALAARLGIHFADAGDWGISLAYDGVHFMEQGHQAFAARLLEVLR